MIEVDSIVVRFGGVVALDHVSASFSAPVSGIIGPNGAGKTTLLNVFSGFVEPAEGSIRMGSDDLLAMPPYKRARWGLRRSFQAEQVVDDLSAEDNIRVMLDALPLSRRERDSELMRVMEFTNLTSHADTMGASLTMLNRRMTEICKALVGGPKIVMLDEPGGGLSGQESEQLRDVILSIPETFNCNVLLIDHDVDLIRTVCQETLVIDFGKKIAFGDTGDVLEDPKVRAAYLGEEIAE